MVLPMMEENCNDLSTVQSFELYKITTGFWDKIHFNF